jgi:hypothetical protein
MVANRFADQNRKKPASHRENFGKWRNVRDVYRISHHHLVPRNEKLAAPEALALTSLTDLAGTFSCVKSIVMCPLGKSTLPP